jgi:hypothetical protein
METYQTQWRWALAAGFAIAILTVLPQVCFVVARGSDWHGANAEMHPDEVAYSAYINSLIRGRSRRNDPYTGLLDQPGKPAPESLFSIQLIPAYTAALPARMFGLSAAGVFIVFPVLCALAASLAVFWLVSLLTRDSRFAAASVFVVLCLGTPMARQGIVRYVPNLPYLIPMWLANLILPPSAYHLPFVRFYQPAIGFPLFFLLCILLWLALTTMSERKALLQARMAGVVFALLVFTYFYLWTAAAAWLGCVGLVWFLARRNERRRVVIVFAIVIAIGLVAMVPYFLMLSRRASTADTAQALVSTRRPDLFRLCEITSLLILASLAFGVVRRKFRFSDHVVLFAGSLAFSVLLVFNQQVITGRSLQPIHYEWFIGNYCALTAIVLTAFLFWRDRSSKMLTGRRLLVVALMAFCWGAVEVWLCASRQFEHNRRVDEVRAAATRLTDLALTDGTIRAEEGEGAMPVVLISDLALADRLPTDAPQALLWSPRMLVFPGVTEEENRQRFLQQLYYLGFDEQKMWDEMNRADWNFFAGMFPYYRLSRVISGHSDPIFPHEMRAQVQNYLAFAQSFNREKAASPRLSYILLPADRESDFSNVDRWYERDAGERIGEFVLYRVKLRE